jgi:hypothetical protein
MNPWPEQELGSYFTDSDCSVKCIINCSLYEEKRVALAMAMNRNVHSNFVELMSEFTKFNGTKWGMVKLMLNKTLTQI